MGKKTIISKDLAATICSWWHEGQNSALYSFCSSKEYVDEKFDQYMKEIADCIPADTADKTSLSQLKNFFKFKHSENE